MSATELDDLADVLARVKDWSPTSRIALARRILESLETPADVKLRRGRPVRELIGLGAGGAPPPDDPTVRRWIDEYRMGKYGP